MIGRQVAALIRVPTRGAHVVRFRTALCANNRISVSKSLSTTRSYATPGRPKKAVGEPSRTVKRSVKRAAKTADDPEKSAAATKVKAKKESVSSKKTASKKTTSKKKPGPKPKKELTPAQKAVKASKAKTLTIANLKKVALDAPAIAKNHAYSKFVAPSLSECLRTQPNSKERASKLSTLTKQLGEQWRALDPAEIQHYNHLANTAKQESLANYKRWVESHTVEEIALANKARRSLRKHIHEENSKRGQPKLRVTKWAEIKDERKVKQPLQPYVLFFLNRASSADFHHMSPQDRTKLIGQEWNALTEDEKKKYQNLAAQDRERYANEHSLVLGQASAYNEPTQHAAAAAA